MPSQHFTLRVFLIALLVFSQTIMVGLDSFADQSIRPALSAPPFIAAVGLVLYSAPYSEMSAKEQTEFIKREFTAVAAKLSPLPVELPDEAVPAIKHWVDAYARRVGNKETTRWQEDLRFLFRRAVHFTPAIIQAYREQHVPPLLGVYLPFIETEYRNLASVNPTGAAGLFQFTDTTTKTYALAPTDRTQVEKLATATARYAYDRLREFDQDVTGVCLTIASFSRSPSAVRREFQAILKSKIRDQDFWLLLKNKTAGEPQFKAENLQFVPRFFAAAIIGENPRSFKLSMLPLSFYSEVSSVKPIPPDQLEKAAVQVIREISNDASYTFTPQVLQELASEVEFLRCHATRLRKMRDDLKTPEQSTLLEEAQLQSINLNLLQYLAMAREVYGSGVGHYYSSSDLKRLKSFFESQFADSALLLVAASQIRSRDEQSHPLLVDIQRLVKNPQTERNVWFLHEQGAINAETYDFVLRVLAIGIIAQKLVK